jgi:hypothetical protein
MAPLLGRTAAGQVRAGEVLLKDSFQLLVISHQLSVSEHWRGSELKTDN